MTSLRLQLQLWHGALLVALTTILLVGFYHYEKTTRLAAIDATLTAEVIALLPRHIPLPGERRPPGEPYGKQRLEERLEASGHYIFITRRDGGVAYRSAGAPAIPPVPPQPRASFARWNGPNREVIHVTPGRDFVLLGRSGASIAAGMRAFALQLAAAGLGVVALGVVGGFLLTGRALRPLRVISATARRIAVGGWHERIPADQAPAELEQLRLVLNDTFERLAAAYEQQRRFTADASHELGTPVAVVLAKTQHALARPRTEAEYRDALAACRRAAERMRALNRDLLDLAAFDAAEAPPHRIECDLAEIAGEAIDLLLPQPETRQAHIDAHLTPVIARVDPLRLSQVLVNLLKNALVHNAPGVRVTLRLTRAGDHAVFTVADNGAGIPAEALPHVFDRFFRAARARSRDDGGSGLGLAVCREIIRQHHGELTAANAPTGGALFTVRLPLSREA